MKTIIRKGIPLAATVLIAACADLALEADRVPTSMEISTHDILIREDQSAKLDVEVRDQNDEIMPLPSWAPLQWEVVDPTIADVALDGSVNPLKGGETRVLVKLAGLGAASRIRINPNQVALSAPLIYVTQSIQTHDHDVVLIAGRAAVVRVFMVGDETSFYGPSVRIRMLLDDQEIFRQDYAQERDRTPSEVIESELDGSVNAVIPGTAIRPGVRMVVELDPEGVVPLAPGSRTRYPESGSMPLTVKEVPLFRQIIVPTIHVTSSNESIVAWANGLSLDHPYIQLLRALLPVAEMELEIHEPFRANLVSGWGAWLNDMRTMFLQEGRRGYYHGAARQSAGNLLGVAYLGVPASVAINRADVYTHEVGHNMSLFHAPCGVSGDPNFPHGGASIGYWGYDPFRKTLKSPRDFVDVMSYCNPVWISDYHFTRATAHRLSGDGGVILDAPPVAAGGAEGKVLVVRGLLQDGGLMLEPAFVLTGSPALPESDGPYRVDGIGVDGQTEFSLSFSPTPMEHGGGGFVFLVPYRADWAETLDRMVLTGPEGTDTVTRTGLPPMAVVTNPATGVIQAIIRDWDGGALPGEGVSRVTITRGIPTGESR